MDASYLKTWIDREVVTPQDLNEQIRDVFIEMFNRTDDTGWIALPPLQNGWTPYPNWEVPAYRKKSGLVFLKGLLMPGTTGAGVLLFTLPAGFRNTGPSHTPIAAGTSTGGALNIYSDGRVNTNYGCTNWISLNNICYPADN